MEQGIDSISLNPDTVIKTTQKVSGKEMRIKKDSMMFVDVHAHLNFPDYKNDIDEVIRRAQEKTF